MGEADNLLRELRAKGPYMRRCWWCGADEPCSCDEELAAHEAAEAAKRATAPPRKASVSSPNGSGEL